jgi:hypothetical protein
MKSWITKLLVLVCLISFVPSCNLLQGEKEKSPNVEESKTDDFVTFVKSAEDFKALSGDPLSDKFSGVLSVKVIWDIQNNAIYYTNSEKYEYHYTFCKEKLDFWGELAVFNTLNYNTNPLQKYCLANINFYPDLSSYCIEFTSSTYYSDDQIVQFTERIQNSFFTPNALKLIISSDYLTDLLNNGDIQFPYIFPDEIFKSQKYQMLNAGKTLGRLVFLDSLDKQYTKVSPFDIIVIHGSPIYIPPCAAIITDQHQSPLSHINVLSKHRMTPSFVDTEIWKNDSLLALNGKHVRLIVSAERHSIETIYMDEWNSYIQNQPAVKTIALEYSLKENQIYPISEIRIEDKKFAGNKAASFGELSLVAKRNKKLFSVPEGAFVIPFYYYDQHLKQPEIAASISKLLNNELLLSNPDSLQKYLKKIRKSIKKSKLSPTLLQAIETQIGNNKIGNSYRYRSSSNAEDIEGFSGAGLYNSKTGILGDTARSVDEAVLDVWAGAWNYGAFMERHIHHIDQLSMKMAVLVHRNFPDEKTNGVAVTANIYRSLFTGFTINTQLGDIDVVSPPEGVMSEQVLLINSVNFSADNARIVQEYITYSSLSPSKPLLTKEEYEQLFKALDVVKTHFYWNAPWTNTMTYSDYALDLEFKFDKNGKLYLKQVRPY